MKQYYDNLIYYRRIFRQMAETGFLEMNTTIELIRLMKSFGFQVRYGREIHGHREGMPLKTELELHASTLNQKEISFDISDIKLGYTGLIADFDTGRPGPKIAFRFDIDALPIKETAVRDHLPNQLNFRSKDENTCHACGHDAHIAMGIVLCKYISEHHDMLCGSIRIIFQPAEEGVHGAKSMMEKGCVDGVDYMVGCHIGMNEHKDTIGVGTKDFLSTKKFNVTYWGRSAHAANNPEQGRNALLGGASLCLTLNSLIQYSSSNTKLNIGRFLSGQNRNIIAQDCSLEAEVRADHYTTLSDLWERIVQAVQGTALSFGLQYRIDVVGEAPDFKTEHPQFESLVNKTLLQQGFKTDFQPSFNGSEDVTYMLKKVEENGGKSIHFLIGAKLAAPHHNEAFDFNEDSMFLGFSMFTHLFPIIYTDYSSK